MKKRDSSIDFLRATAVFLMVITHVNALLYSGKNSILDIFTTAGVTLCFSTFLFCSAYIDGLKIEKGKDFNIKKVLKRIFNIYIVYVLCGIFVTLVFQEGITIDQILNIIILNYVPEFTEFLIAFILFSFLPLIFSKQIKQLLSKPLLLVFLTISIYFLGSLISSELSKYSLPNYIRILVENIFGYQNQHRFPIIPYLPIYSFGILLSKYKSNRILFKTLVISLLLFFLLYFFKLSHWYRWPPSVLFLFYSFAYIPLILLIFRKFERTLSKSIFKLFTNVGKYPLEQFALSTLLVFTAKAFIPSTGNEFVSILVNIIILGFLTAYPIVFYRKMV